MTHKEEELMLHMYEKNEKLKEKNAKLEEENALLKDKQKLLMKAVTSYDFMMHEFESMLLNAGASKEVIQKLKDRGLANAHV